MDRSPGARRNLAWLPVVAMPYLALIFAYRQWWGEWCPPARYLLPVLPLLALPMAAALRAARTLYDRALFALLLALSLAVSAIFVAMPRLMYNHPTGQSELLLWLGEQVGADLAIYLPAIVYPNLWSAPLAVFWLGLFLLLLIPSSYLFPAVPRPELVQETSNAALEQTTEDNVHVKAPESIGEPVGAGNSGENE